MRYTYINIGVMALLLAILGTSCSSYKNRNILFKTQDKIKTTKPVLIINPTYSNIAVYRHRIKVGDRLVLRFLNNYDLGIAAKEGATAVANADLALSGTNAGYLVNYDSTCILPLIGRINLIGLTRIEASVRLEKEYSKFVVNPIIDLNIASLGVTILGEVARPGKIYVDKDNTTLVDVIAMAGGFKDAGKKNDIKIIRGKEVIIVDLRKIESLQSPDITIHDNDIVYIEPYKVKADTEPLASVLPVTTIVLAALQTALLVTQLFLIYK